MKISNLIELLEEIKGEFGDREIDAFHHEGGNSLRAYPDQINKDSFRDNDNNGVLTIGGYYDRKKSYSLEKVKDADRSQTVKS